MARFNTTSHRAIPPVATATSPIATVTATPNTRTFEGAPGFTRTAQGEVFLLSAGAFLDGKGSFYESGADQDARLRSLVTKIALEDPQWGLDFATWLRGPGNMRTSALMFAADFVKARLDEQKRLSMIPGPSAVSLKGDVGINRRIISAVCRRPDEPGELLAYWTANYGRGIPKPVKRGIADAVRRAYNSKALLKYDTDSHAYRFGDILNLVHATPDPDKPWQGDLFQYALDRRHNPDTATPPATDPVITAHRELMELPVADRRAVVTGPGGADRLAKAGMTWETLAGWIQGPMDKAVWEAMIPSMKIMALIRNLRNFDQAGISDEVAQRIINQLTNPEVIANSQQFPFRFLAAYRATKDAGSLRWAYPLEQALNHSLANVPSLGGRTLILVDRSPSMFPEGGYYAPNETDRRLGISRADQAAIFGCALALRAENATLVEFGFGSNVITVPKGSSVLPLVDRFTMIGGTDIPSAVKNHYDNHDRVVVITDEQTRAGYFPSNWSSYQRTQGMPETAIDALVPLNVPVFMWNLAGYKAAAMPSGSNARFTLGGLTDKAFALIPLLEAGAQGVWPWQATASA